MANVSIGSDSLAVIPDTALVEARERWTDAYLSLLSLDDSERSRKTAEGRRLWSIVDEAEEVIRSSVAATPRGAAIQLWTPLHYWDGDGDNEALIRGDLSGLTGRERDFDWTTRLALAALRSLERMESNNG